MRRRVTWVSTVVMLTVPLVVGVATTASADPATRYVTMTGSDTLASGSFANNCSQAVLPCRTVAHAIAEAVSGDTVSIATGTYDESVTVTTPLTIVGAGSPMPTLAGDGANHVTVDVDGSSAPAPIAVSVQNVSLTGNTHEDGLQVGAATVDLSASHLDNDLSGAFVEGGATLTATNSTFNGNSFGLYDSGSVNLTDSVASGNTHDGVAVLSDSTSITGSVISGNAGYGVSADGGSVTVAGSMISGNARGGVEVGFDSGQASTATITGSTVSGNTVVGAEASTDGTMVINKSTVSGTGPAVGPQPEGGGLLVAGGELQASEVTVYGNTNFGVGVDGTAAPSQATVANSTIAATTEGSTPSSLLGGSVAVGKGATLTVSGSIDASNEPPACGGGTTDNGYNLASDSTCKFHANGSQQQVAAKLGKLANNGGPTKTVLPGVTSPARNAIPFGKAGCVMGATDQRNQPRRSPAAGKCDVGSVEAKVVNPKLHAKVVGHKAGGRYHGPVTVKYHCAVRTARLTHKCPKPTHLKSSGKHHVKKTIHAVDGGSATVKLTIKIA